jgi:hypothetical protein
MLRPTEPSDRTTPVSGHCSKVQQGERAPMRLAGATVGLKDIGDRRRERINEANPLHAATGVQVCFAEAGG